jgi:hypothetical protein
VLSYECCVCLMNLQISVYTLVTFYTGRGSALLRRRFNTVNSELIDQAPGSSEGLNSHCVLPVVKGDHIKLYVWFGKLAASIKRV